MRQRDSQKGAVLVLVIGVVATLAVLSGALVFLTGNASSNTARDRNRAKAFNVAEAAVDLALYKVGTDWPLTSNVTFPSPTPTPNEKTVFLGRFPPSEFPNADVSITYFDNVNVGTTVGDTVSNGVRYDKNADGLIYIEAQASVGGEKARIQCEATRVYFDSKFPRGIAAAANGDITSNGSKPAIGMDGANGGYMAPDQTALTVMAGRVIADSNKNGTVADPAYFPEANVQQGLGSGMIDSVLDPGVVQQFITTAQAQGHWYSDIASEQAKGAKSWPDTNTIAPFEGIVVLETISPNKLALNGNGTYNGDGVSPNKPPGVLMVIGPKTMYPDDSTKTGYSGGVDLGGTGKYYGVMYTDGSIGGNGNITIAGMALAGGSIDLAGDRRIEYNDNVVQNLSKAVQVSAQIVPNTWRQIKPL
jgi:hypothetical protein